MVGREGGWGECVVVRCVCVAWIRECACVKGTSKGAGSKAIAMQYVKIEKYRPTPPLSSCIKQSLRPHPEVPPARKLTMKSLFPMIVCVLLFYGAESMGGDGGGGWRCFESVCVGGVVRLP